MRTLITSIVVLLLSGTLLFAQGSKYTKSVRHGNAIEPGARALLFKFDGLNQLRANPYQGGIGGKYYLSEALAARGVLNFLTQKKTDPYTDTTTAGKNGKTIAAEFGLSGVLEYHLNSLGRTSPYIGGGFKFLTASTEKTAAARLNDVPVVTKNSRYGVDRFGGGDKIKGRNEFGFFGVIGAEIFLMRQISLAPEYQFGYLKVSRKKQEITNARRTVVTELPDENGFGVFNKGLFTLTVYF